jgi:hypothetical protein
MKKQCSSPFWESDARKRRVKKVAHNAHLAQDLQFLAPGHSIRNRNRPAKQVGDQRWLNQHS